MGQVSKKNRVNVEDRVTKAALVNKLQQRYEKELGVTLPLSTLNDMLNVTMSEVKKTLVRGNAIFLSGFGTFYRKRMKARTVVSNFDGEQKTYKVRAKTKLGFTSFNSADTQVTQRRVQ